MAPATAGAASPSSSAVDFETVMVLGLTRVHDDADIGDLLDALRLLPCVGDDSSPVVWLTDNVGHYALQARKPVGLVLDNSVLPPGAFHGLDIKVRPLHGRFTPLRVPRDSEPELSSVSSAEDSDSSTSSSCEDMHKRSFWTRTSRPSSAGKGKTRSAPVVPVTDPPLLRLLAPVEPVPDFPWTASKEMSLLRKHYQRAQGSPVFLFSPQKALFRLPGGLSLELGSSFLMQLLQATGPHLDACGHEDRKITVFICVLLNLFHLRPPAPIPDFVRGCSASARALLLSQFCWMARQLHVLVSSSGQQLAPTRVESNRALARLFWLEKVSRGDSRCHHCHVVMSKGSAFWMVRSECRPLPARRSCSVGNPCSLRDLKEAVCCFICDECFEQNLEFGDRLF